jgi:hypothetical protein
MDTSAIVAKWGQLYIDQGQTQKDITSQLFEKEKTDSLFSPVMEKNTVYRHTFAEADGVLQAMIPKYHSKGGESLDPHEQKLGRFKINKDLTPDDVENTYAAFLADLPQVDRTKWPLVRWAIEKMYIPKSKDEYESDVAYRGWQVTGYNASPTVNGTTLVRELASADAVLPANASMDGIWIQIVRGVAASKINVISTGALSADPQTFVEQIEAFMMAIPDKARGQIDKLMMSEANYNKYLDGIWIKYNVNYLSQQDPTAIRKTMAKVDWIRGMDGSNKIWCTRAKNRVRPTHVENTGKFIVLPKDAYTVSIATDWKKVITFESPQLVFTNDLENTITAPNITTYYS